MALSDTASAETDEEVAEESTSCQPACLWLPSDSKNFWHPGSRLPPVEAPINRKQNTDLECSLITWLDEEVKARLERLDSKFDSMLVEVSTLTQQMGGCLDDVKALATDCVGAKNHRGSFSRFHRDSLRSSGRRTESLIQQLESLNEGEKILSETIVSETPENAELKHTGLKRYSTWGSLLSDGTFSTSNEIDSKNDSKADSAAESILDIESEDTIPPKFPRKTTAMMPMRSATLRRLSYQAESKINFVLRRTQHRNKHLEKLWDFLEDPDSSIGSRLFTKMWTCFIVTSVFVSIAQTVTPPLLNATLAGAIETAFDCIFIMEVFIRYIACPNSCMFIASPYNLVDLLAPVSLILRLALGFALPADSEHVIGGAFLLCGVPILRLLKILRHFKNFHLFLKVLADTFDALQFLLSTMFIIVITSSSLVYLVEPRHSVDSLPRAMWLTIVTMTTVGYGDMVPETLAGTLIVAVLVVGSVLYMSMPIGVIGNTFFEIWNDRDKILLINKTRGRLVQWGYTASDLPRFFNHFCSPHSQTGSQNSQTVMLLPEFRGMMKELKMDLTEDRLVQLFETFDLTGRGTVTEREFVRALFPSAYHEIYNSNANSYMRSGSLNSQITGFTKSIFQPMENLSSRLSGRTSRPSFGVAGHCNEHPQRATT